MTVDELKQENVELLIESMQAKTMAQTIAMRESRARENFKTFVELVKRKEKDQYREIFKELVRWAY